jgi:hypothetical protein
MIALFYCPMCVLVSLLEDYDPVYCVASTRLFYGNCMLSYNDILDINGKFDSFSSIHSFKEEVSSTLLNFRNFFGCLSWLVKSLCVCPCVRVCVCVCVCVCV